MTTFKVHYMKPDFFRDGSMGVEWLKKYNMLPELGSKLADTHVELKTLDLEPTSYGGNELDALERIWIAMQGENWSPNGEARPLIRSKGLQHTSMSVGDAVVVNEGRLYMVDRFGFKLIDEEPRDTDGSLVEDEGQERERLNDRLANQRYKD